MKLVNEQKNEILNVLYEIYDTWQTNLTNAVKTNCERELIEDYENKLNSILDFIEEFKATGEIDFSHIILYSVCIHAIFHREEERG